ncbi:UNKNOWN [Stylonychia lemnae]|uniref:CUE domain-containing protein n=1 Tax=Stylonychia lemnae TaxID=5949 RepID=A0A077ZWF0_STYLE|nr:UNKNOWN [Stylonychia lemnae]|eukprot:CDW72771.1 UNKNOWN [Stylonychia lemnae]
MPPKKFKGKKGVKIVSDLTSFNNQEVKKQQEKDFNQSSTSDQQKSVEKSQQLSQASVQSDSSRCEEEFGKFQPEDINIPNYYLLDNKLIDAYYAKLENFSEEEKDILQDAEFSHFSRLINRDLEFILNLRFTHFWSVIIKLPEILRFLDEFLQNVRKYNDIYKVQFIEFTEKQSQNEVDQNEPKQGLNINQQIKESMSKMLYLVLRIFYRLSVYQESEEVQFTLPFYSRLVYDNWVFDMAKVIDIAAVYGKSNQDIVHKIINNIFENDKRYVEDFKEAVDSLFKLIKKTFKEYSTIQAMIKGEHVKEMTHKELEAHILNYLTDYTEILSNINLITSTFPGSVLDTLRGTNSIIYLANSYCLTLQMKRDLVNKLNIYIPKIKGNTDKNLKKLHGVVQSQIAQQLKIFAMTLTGNNEVSKEILPKQINYITVQNEQETIGTTFLRRVLKRIDMLGFVKNIEDRFLPDGEKDFLKIILESLQKGQKVQVKKINAITHDKQVANHKNDQKDSQSHLKLQDKENIHNLFDMSGGTVKKEIIEQMYLKYDKNVELTLDQILSGNIPKDEYKLVVINKDQQVEQIDTSTHQNKAQNSELLQQYMLGAFEGSKARTTKNKKYYQEHLRAIEQQKYEEDNEDKDFKMKMLHLAGQMQYEDDFDDQNLYLEKNKNRNKQKQQESDDDDDDYFGLEKDQNKPAKKATPQTQSSKILQKTKEKDVQPQDDDEDDDMDDIDKLLEGLDEDEDQNYIFEDDEKRKKQLLQQEEQRKKQDQERQQQQQRNDQKGQRGKDQDKRQNQGRGQNDRGGDYQNNNNSNSYNQRGKRQDYHQQQSRDEGGYKDREQRPQQKQEFTQKFVPKGQQQNRENEEEKSERHERDDQSSRGSYQRGGYGGYSDRGRGRGQQRGGRGGRGRGYSDNYQREENDNDRYYTSSNPLQGEDLENKYDKPPPRNEIQNHKVEFNQDYESGEDEESQSSYGRGRGRGTGRGRGRGGQGSRGGHHDQKNRNQKKQGAYYPS